VLLGGFAIASLVRPFAYHVVSQPGLSAVLLLWTVLILFLSASDLHAQAARLARAR
jgi:hypothetical protein